MITKEAEGKYLYVQICREYKETILPGTVFKKLVCPTTENCFISHWRDTNKEFVAVGYVYPHELLVRSVDGKMYVSLIKGWGVKDGSLYAIDRYIHMGFDKAVTFEEMKYEYNHPPIPHGWCSAMGVNYRQTMLAKLIKAIETMGGTYHENL